MTIAIRGAGSNIAKELIKLLPEGENVIDYSSRNKPVTMAERHLFCRGLLKGSKIIEQDEEDLSNNFLVNAAYIMQECDAIIEDNDRARICVVGSESGFSGSFDMAYASSKAALHMYVENKKLRTPDQQLVCIAPSIIADAGMTTRRTDVDNLKLKMEAHPKKRFLMAEEVANFVHYVLYVDKGYLSGVVLRMNGGQHIR